MISKSATGIWRLKTLFWTLRSEFVFVYLMLDFTKIPPRFLNYQGGLGVTDKVVNTQTGDKLKLLPIPEDKENEQGTQLPTAVVYLDTRS